MRGELRQKALMATAGVIVLYAIAAGVWFFSAEAAWKKAAKGYDKAKDTYQREVRLIGEKNKWTADYESEKAQTLDKKQFRNMISKFRRRIESTFNQLIEHFDIERVRANSIISLLTSLEIKFLCFNILTYIGGTTKISKILNFN